MHQYLYSDQPQQSAAMHRRKLLPRSRSLASMLPSFVLSGVVTCLMTALMCFMWLTPEGHFFSTWIESWLTLWPIAFPVMYLLSTPLRKLAAHISP